MSYKIVQTCPTCHQPPVSKNTLTCDTCSGYAKNEYSEFELEKGWIEFPYSNQRNISISRGPGPSGYCAKYVVPMTSASRRARDLHFCSTECLAQFFQRLGANSSVKP